VGLDGAFHELSTNIKFIEFGSVELVLCNFETNTSIEFEKD
jgi:hypothetical protein